MDKMDAMRPPADKTHAAGILAAAGVGALIMYLLDPQQGRRRVALARDQALRLARKSRLTADAGLRDLGHRASGMAAQLRSRLSPQGATDNDVLAERVRAQLGRWVSHPRAIEVKAASGWVTVAGPVLAHEERRLLHGLHGVRGVRDVINRLDVHWSPDIPALRGGRSRGQPRPEFLQQNWAPGPRLLAFAAGSAAAAWGLSGRRSLTSALVGVAGACLAARAATNRDLARLIGASGGQRGIEFEKAIHIDAPRERVFDLWSDFANFPHFMSRVKQVEVFDDTHSHWVVEGPAGRQVEWDSVLTESERPWRLAWRSDEGSSPVQHAGSVRFDDDRGGTRVTLRMSYQPPGGALGHGVAALFGSDPKHALDADLMRMKAFIESGATPRDAAQPDTTSATRAAQPAVSWPTS